MDGRRGGWGTRRAGGGAAWTSSGAGGGAKQKGESDGAVRIRTKGSKVEVIIMDKAEQRKQEMREAEAEAKRRATRIVKMERRKQGKKKKAMREAKTAANEVVRKVVNTLKDKRKELSDKMHNARRRRLKENERVLPFSEATRIGVRAENAEGTRETLHERATNLARRVRRVMRKYRMIPSRVSSRCPGPR